MILKIPLITQEKDSKDCGLAGLAMILKYYNLDISLGELKKELEVDEIGTYAPQLGSYLIKKGFEIEIITLHPKLFTNQDKNLTSEEILKRFEKLKEESKSERDKKALNYFIIFLKEGGKINIKIPLIEDIREEINNKRPLCALMTSCFLNSNKPCFNFHFNIISGFDEEHIYALDPLPDEGGKKKYKISDFFYGLYASAYGDLDNACLIKIKKKS